jgi:polyhydroxyalkanoate synthesis regulator phasin
MSRQVSKAINSPVLEEIIGKQLRDMGESYYLLYRLSIETGYVCGDLLRLNVRDVYKKKVIKIPSKLTSKERDREISDELYSDLTAFCDNRPLSQALFIGSKSGTRLNFPTFQKALLRVSHSLGINPVLTASALRKTYLFHVIMITGNTAALKKEYNQSLSREMYESLGISPEECEDLIHSASTARSAITQMQLVKKIRRECDNALDDIAVNMQVPATSSTDYCKDVLALLCQINTAVTVFNALTQENPVRQK